MSHLLFTQRTAFTTWRRGGGEEENLGEQTPAPGRLLPGFVNPKGATSSRDFETGFESSSRWFQFQYSVVVEPLRGCGLRMCMLWLHPRDSWFTQVI